MINLPWRRSPTRPTPPVARKDESLSALADPGEYLSIEHEAAVSEGWPLSQREATRSAGADRRSTQHTGAEHHTLAAEHHELAARHHRNASARYDAKEFADAARHSLTAHDHAQRALYHSTEAGKYHAERARRHAQEKSS